MSKVGTARREASSTAEPTPSRDPAPDGLSATLERELLESLPDPVIGCDSSGEVVLWSRAAEELYGYTASEALGRRLAALLRTTAPRPLIEIREELADVGRWDGTLRHRTRGGEEVIVESRWLARYDGDGRHVGALGIERALQAPATNGGGTSAAGAPGPATPDEGGSGGGAAMIGAEAETQLRQAERLESLGQLAGGVAHDFNNALAIVINYAAFVDGAIDRLHAAPTPAERSAMRADLAEVRAAAERAARLTQQLLAFSRQEPGALQPVDLNDVIREIETLLVHTAGARVRLELELHDDVSAVCADPAQLHQVLVNLTVNARDAMPGGGTLTIETDELTLDDAAAAALPDLQPGAYVRLRVSDTGTGMSEEVISRVFDPFFTTKPRGHGTGLGLSSVYGIVTRAGGYPRFFSQPGVGTTFVALLPVARPQEDNAVPGDGLPAAPVAPATVLLVEEDRALREVVRRILTEAGYEVMTAGGGLEALDLGECHEGAIDLLVTDIVLAGMPGRRLAEHLRARTPRLAVLYMSGFSPSVLSAGRVGDAGDLAAGDETAIDPAAVVDKPFTASALLRKVAAALGGGDEPRP